MKAEIREHGYLLNLIKMIHFKIAMLYYTPHVDRSNAAIQNRLFKVFKITGIVKSLVATAGGLMCADTLH